MVPRRCSYLLVLGAVILTGVCLHQYRLRTPDRDATRVDPRPREVIEAPSAPSGEPASTHTHATEITRPSTPVNESEDPEDGSLHRDLNDDETRALLRALGEADRTSVESLQDAVIRAAQAQDGRDLHYRAWLMAWALARRPEGITAVRTRLLEAKERSDLSRQLLLAVGMVGTAESISSLLRWLDDPALASYTTSILDALHQTPTSQLDVIAHRYSLHLKGSGSWPTDLHDRTVRSERDVLRATLGRATDDPRSEVRQKAVQIAFSVDGTGASRVDDDIRAALRLLSLDMIQREQDWTLASMALVYVSRTPPDSDVKAAVLDRLGSETSSQQCRVQCASVLARYATSYDDARTVLEWARVESAPGVRSGFQTS